MLPIMNTLSKIITSIALSEPDGRPLYQYPVTPEDFSNLENEIKSQIGLGAGIELWAPMFVFWAAEHIRSRFPGGGVNWNFVLNPLGLKADDQSTRGELTERGLGWWNRNIQLSNTGRRMFLYSLVAEGGLPESFLKDEGLYRSVVIGLLAEIEAESGMEKESWTEQIASRWACRLPPNIPRTRVYSVTCKPCTELGQPAGITSRRPPRNLNRAMAGHP